MCGCLRLLHAKPIAHAISIQVADEFAVTDHVPVYDSVTDAEHDRIGGCWPVGDRDADQHAEWYAAPYYARHDAFHDRF